MKGRRRLVAVSPEAKLLCRKERERGLTWFKVNWLPGSWYIDCGTDPGSAWNTWNGLKRRGFEPPPWPTELWDWRDGKA